MMRVPPNQIAIQLAIKVIVELSIQNLQPHKISPSVEGGIGIEFRNKIKYCDIECFNTGEILGVISKNKDSADVFQIDNNKEDIRIGVKKIKDCILDELGIFY